MLAYLPALRNDLLAKLRERLAASKVGYFRGNVCDEVRRERGRRNTHGQRGQGNYAVSTLMRYLKGTNFPADKEEVASNAEGNGATQEELVGQIRHADVERFESAEEVMRALPAPPTSGEREPGLPARIPRPDSWRGLLLLGVALIAPPLRRRRDDEQVGTHQDRDEQHHGYRELQVLRTPRHRQHRDGGLRRHPQDR